MNGIELKTILATPIAARAQQMNRRPKTAWRSAASLKFARLGIQVQNAPGADGRV
jgi:hypothetical protein